MQTKHDAILPLAMKSYLCSPTDSEDEHKSHFLGKPKHSVESLFHLSTLFASDIKELSSINSLSFYVDINNLEEDSKLTISDCYFETANNFMIQEILDIPIYNHSLIFELQLSYDELDQYNEMRSFYFEHIISKDIESVEYNKILGYPDSIQNCVSYEAERIKNNRDYDDAIYEEAQNWMLLLQISPYCKKFNFFEKFGDGSIYFMIRKDDFRKRSFDNCQVVVQNT